MIYASMITSSTEVGNHFIHTEVFSHYGTERQNRRISYVSLKIPVKDGMVKMSVGKKIDIGCSIDFAVYLNGDSM